MAATVPRAAIKSKAKVGGEVVRGRRGLTVLEAALEAVVEVLEVVAMVEEKIKEMTKKRTPTTKRTMVNLRMKKKTPPTTRGPTMADSSRIRV